MCSQPRQITPNVDWKSSLILKKPLDNFDFLLAPNRDLYAIKKRNTAKQKTEVHVLTAASNYSKRGLEVATDLEEAPDNFDFQLASNGDLYAIKKRNTAKQKTEVHVLTAASNYSKRATEVVTALDENPESFRFLLGSNGDLYTVKTQETASRKTEVDVLSVTSNYTQFGVSGLTSAVWLPYTGQIQSDTHYNEGPPLSIRRPRDEWAHSHCRSLYHYAVAKCFV